MNFYILLAIAVNFIWGLAFLIPYYLIDVNPVIIVSGRYIFYGLIALILLLLHPKDRKKLTKNHWKMAMIFAFFGNIGYYLVLTSAIHLIGIARSALIVGTLPVTMALYANWKNREFTLSKLTLPILFILTGLLVLNWLQYSHDESIHDPLRFFGGLAMAVLALALWTWYGVHNARYLKKHTEISGHAWSNATGVSCLIQAVIFLPLLTLGSESPFNHFSPDLIQKTLIGTAILGVFVSWFSAICWNNVSRHLPTSLAAQLIVFETISSLLYGCILDQRIPPPSIILCIVMILFGIIMAIRVALTKPLKMEI